MDRYHLCIATFKKHKVKRMAVKHSYGKEITSTGLVSVQVWSSCYHEERSQHGCIQKAPVKFTRIKVQETKSYQLNELYVYSYFINGVYHRPNCVTFSFPSIMSILLARNLEIANCVKVYEQLNQLRLPKQYPIIWLLWIGKIVRAIGNGG